MRFFLLVLILALAGFGAWYSVAYDASVSRFTDTEAGFLDIEENSSWEPEIVVIEDSGALEIIEPIIEPLMGGGSRYSGWSVYWREFSPEEERFYGNWTRPPGPTRVGIQVGHWKNQEVPEELDGLKRNGGGAQGGGYTEVETVLKISQLVQEYLEDEGVVVDLLPATVPIDYVADAFVSIHADGSSNTSVSGFKISGPRRDFSERADELVEALYDSYEKTTGMKRDGSITRRMSSYYVFNWRRYDHALHPMTPAAIFETGFMTSAADRAIIVSQPEKAARGIADGILDFLN